MYTYSCGVLTSVPADATVLIQAIDEDSFIAGCCLNEDGTPIDGFVEAIALERNGMDLTIFANSVNNRAHQQDDYRYVTNTIYAKMLSNQPLDLDAVSVSFTDVPDSHWPPTASPMRWTTADDRHLLHRLLPRRLHHPRHADDRAGPPGRRGHQHRQHLV